MNQFEKEEAIELLEQIQRATDMALYCLNDQKTRSGEKMSLAANLEDLKRYAPGIASSANSLCSLIKSLK